MKKLYPWLGALLLVIALVIGGRSVHAQTPPPPPPTTPASTTITPTDQSGGLQSVTPQILIKNITLGETTYQSGGIATGTITFENLKSADQSDVYYDVSLAGDYSMASSSWHIPSTIYDTKTYGPVYVKGLSEVTIPFSYQLPGGVSGKGLGLHIIAHLQTGLPLGWGEAFINDVTGGVSMLTLNKGYVEVDGVDYGNQDGPTLNATSTGYAHLSLSNTTADPITVTPQIDLFTRLASASTSISSTKGDSVTIQPGSTQDIKIALNTNNNTPQVYVEEITLLDSAGDLRAPQAQFRYIVGGGPIATIQTVQSDSMIATKGTPMNVTVAFSGSPQDITDGVAPSVGQAVLDVKLFDSSSNALIGESSTSTVNFDVDYGTAVVPVTPTANANSVTVQASIVKDGKVLGQYETTITPAGTIVSRGRGPLIRVIVTTFIALILLVILLLLIVKRKKLPPASASLLILIALGLGISSFLGAHNALAQFTQTGCSTNTSGTYLVYDICRTPPIVSSPANGTAFPSGQPFQFSGVLENYRCGNAVENTSFTSYLDGAQGQASSIHYNPTGAHYAMQNYTLFSFYYNTAGLAYGAHTLSLNIADSQTQSDRQYFENNWSGYETFYVVPPAPAAPTISSPGGALTCDDTSYTFNWNAVANATQYGVNIQIGSGAAYVFDAPLGTSDTVTPLIPGDTYTAYAYAYDSGGWSVASNPITFTAPSTESCNINSSGDCINGGSNPPLCTLNPGGSCINGANNPASCTTCGSDQTMVGGSCVNNCTNGGTNPPLCTINPAGACLDGANNPASCNSCPTGQTYAGGTCVANCTNGATNPPACNACPSGESLYQGTCQANCGSILAGQSVTMYSIQGATASASCAANAEVRTCVNGTLSGDANFQYGSCAPAFQEF